MAYIKFKLGEVKAIVNEHLKKHYQSAQIDSVANVWIECEDDGSESINIEVDLSVGNK